VLYHKTIVALISAATLLFAALHVAPRAEAGLFDRAKSKKKSAFAATFASAPASRPKLASQGSRKGSSAQEIRRAQSPEWTNSYASGPCYTSSGSCNEGFGCKTRSFFAEMCERKRERHSCCCDETYYPRSPPFCQPCWGHYPTCWRRMKDCWVCPREDYAMPAPPQSSPRYGVPPAGTIEPPAALPAAPPVPATPAPAEPSAYSPRRSFSAPRITTARSEFAAEKSAAGSRANTVRWAGYAGTLDVEEETLETPEEETVDTESGADEESAATGEWSDAEEDVLDTPVE
jgi:hypothetical protein